MALFSVVAAASSTSNPYLSGGAQLTFQAQAVDTTTVNKTVVSNRLTWSYTNTCGVQALSAGQELGWVTFMSVPPCPRLGL